MWKLRLWRGLALLNFIGIIGWMGFGGSCRRRPVEPPLSLARAQNLAVTAPSSDAAPARLTSLEAIIACLEGDGGVVGGACRKPIVNVRGLAVRANGEFMAATKAPVMDWPRPREFVADINQNCFTQSMPTRRALLPAEVPPQLDCVLAEVEKRTILP